MRAATWDQRLAAARTIAAQLRAIASAKPGHHLPTGLYDQLVAATAEAADLQQRLFVTLQHVEPDGGWRTPTAPDEATMIERTAHAIAAITGCRSCAHLRRSGPQPAVARLSLHRVDCRRCLATIRRPPPDEDDRCDWCGQQGVESFNPVSVQLGAALVLGDACPDCFDQIARPRP